MLIQSQFTDDFPNFVRNDGSYTEAQTRKIFRRIMTNVEIVSELLKSVPMLERLEFLENFRRLFGLSSDEAREAFWKADGRSDEEIAKIKQELIREAKSDAILKYVSELSTRNPVGNLPLGNPESNIVKIARLAQLTEKGSTLKDAFIEIFGSETYKGVIDSE